MCRAEPKVYMYMYILGLVIKDQRFLARGKFFHLRCVMTSIL